MNKKITIEITQEEYDALSKLWVEAKKSPIMPSKALNFDDFCKELLLTCVKMPDLSNANVEELMSSIGDLGGLDNLKEMFDSLTKKKEKPKQEPKKDDVPDDQKYKS